MLSVILVGAHTFVSVAALSVFDPKTLTQKKSQADSEEYLEVDLSPDADDADAAFSVVGVEMFFRTRAIRTRQGSSFQCRG